jgi:4-aminobutyrate---pyruvate transaminase
VAHVRELGARLKAGLAAIASRSGIVGQVRGEGLMIGVELVADPPSRAAFDPALKVGALFDAQALENGLIIRAMGDTIGLCPPLSITAAEIDETLDLFGRALRDVEERVASRRSRAAE